MPVHIEWDNDEKTVVLFRLDKDWTWEELFATLEQQWEMYASVNHPIDSIVYIEEMLTLPKLLTINSARVSAARHPNTRYIMAVTNSMLVRAAVGMLKRMRDPIALKIRFASTIEEARIILREKK